MIPGLSVLETVPVPRGSDWTAALRASLDLAALADSLGYLRIWVAEHHGTTTAGSVSPAVLACRMGSVTRRIRVGAGGVLLAHHAPLVVAEQFMMLEALFPGRVDLGICRGQGADGAALRALRWSEASDDAYDDAVDELVALVNGPVEGLPVLRPPCPPRMFVLGSSMRSARAAASRGLSLALAHYQNPGETARSIQTYRHEYSDRWGGPGHAVAAVRVLGRDSDEEASRDAIRSAVIHVREAIAKRGSLVADDEQILDSAVSESERAIAETFLERGDVVVGGVDRVRSSLLRLAMELDVDELMIVPAESDGDGRLETLRTVALAQRRG